MSSHPPHAITLNNGKRVLIRTVELSDAAAMLALAIDGDATSDFQATEPDEREQNTEEKKREWINKQLTLAGNICLVAIVDERLVGAIVFYAKEKRRMAHYGYFGISVHNTQRATGIGTALIKTLLAWATTHPTIEKVCLGVFAQNLPALRLYRRLGFRIEGYRMREFKTGLGQYHDDVQMYKFVKDPT